MIQANLSSAASIQDAAAEISTHDRLDSLINDAAVFDLAQKSAAFSPEGHELFWATNRLGPFALTAHVPPQPIVSRIRVLAREA
ncbi:hypothetical protein I6E74_05465 [Salinibacterium sp. SWN139]|uniref:hypothetical protein n=1 Tax=Salinibacterium sp. SWN139 TaxID=2792055 RepID=UPI0018CFE7D1|nr:hypothetical protein [Salinibacterium sp. SWN139]MBH0053620.1 hypothetical protein [Salinibacterium sp. SWN139]